MKATDVKAANRLAPLLFTHLAIEIDDNGMSWVIVKPAERQVVHRELIKHVPSSVMAKLAKANLPKRKRALVRRYLLSLI